MNLKNTFFFINVIGGSINEFDEVHMNFMLKE